MTSGEPDAIAVYLEAGKKKVFACAVDWPGWSRDGKDEAAALERLLAYAPRYGRMIALAELPFSPPRSVSAFRVVERLQGNATTDFGAPGMVPAADGAALDEAGLERMLKIVRACWAAFDGAVEQARRFESAGGALRKGPRGGGRGAEGIFDHVLNAEAGYLSASGGMAPGEKDAPPGERMTQIREAMLATLAAGARGAIPERGPRGGRRWPPRYLARRFAWHILDHLWEIEDRMG